MNFSKLFLMMAFSVSLNNGACGMEQDDPSRRFAPQDDSNNKKRKRDDDPSIYSNELLRMTGSEQSSKKNKKEYDEAATLGLQVLLNNDFYNVSEEKIKEWLTAGADPNIQDNTGSTLLHIVACNDHKKFVEMLLKHGADPNIKNNDGWVPLHIAAWNRQKEIVEILLQYGADLKIKNKGSGTPLHIAVRRDYKEIVETIINFIKDGAKILNDHVQRLMYLCSRDKIFRKKCDIFLMSNRRQHGALKIPKSLYYEILVQSWDPTQLITQLVNAQNNEGKTALNLAREKDHKEIVTLLELYEKK